MNYINHMFNFGTTTAGDRDKVLAYLRERLFTYGRSYIAKTDDAGFIMVNDYEAIVPIAHHVIEKMKDDLNIFFSIKQVSQQLKTIIQSNEIDEIVNQVDITSKEDTYKVEGDNLVITNGYNKPKGEFTRTVANFLSHYPLKALLGIIMDGYINPRKDSFVYQIFPSNFGKSLIIEILRKAGLAEEVESLYSLADPKQNNIYSVSKLSKTICVIEDETFSIHEKIKNITFKSNVNIKFKKAQTVKMGVKLMFGANRVQIPSDPQFANRFHVLDFSGQKPITEKDWYKEVGGRKVIEEVSAFVPNLVETILAEMEEGKNFYDYLAEIKVFFNTTKEEETYKEKLKETKAEIEKELSKTTEEKQADFNKEMLDMIVDIAASINPDEYQRVGILSDTIIKDDNRICLRRGKSSVKKLLSFLLDKQEVNIYMSNWKHFVSMEEVTANKVIRVGNKTAKVLEIVYSDPTVKIVNQEDVDF